MKKKFLYLASLLLFVCILFSQNANAGGSEPMQEPWTVYVGGFAGYANTDYQYGGALFTQIVQPAVFDANSIILGEISTQPGASGGVQLGFQYHFQSPYSLGMNISAAINAGKGRFNIYDAPDVLSVPYLNYQFRVNGNVDIAGVFGMDLAPQTHLYIKLGAAYTTLSSSFFLTSDTLPFPTSFFHAQEHHNLWGWVAGVGLVQDLSRCWSAFLEYDRYDYGRNNLNDVNEFFSSSVLPSFNRLVQNARITASAFRVGFNMKFIGSYTPVVNTVINNPWLLYLGAFSGYSSAAYQYGGSFFATNGAFVSGSSLLSYTTLQQGASGGGQLGLQYHFQSPYFLGLDFGIASDAGKARYARTLVTTTRNDAASYQFRTAYNMGLTAVFGLDITPRTHLYVKLGAAYTRLLQTFVGVDNIVLTNFFERRFHNYFWGWALGAGLNQDLSRWLSVFAEYDRFDYGNNNLSSLTNLYGNPTSPDLLTQHVRLTSSTVRLGLNLKLIGNATLAAPRSMINKSWMAYIGGFVGYYSATFQYEASYFSGGPDAQQTPVTLFQRGFSGGGQFGLQYHFQSPYFMGFNVSGASNASKARITIDNFAALMATPSYFDVRFRIGGNVDIAGKVGVSILPKTALYAKIGASYGCLSITNFFAEGLIKFPAATTYFSKHKNLWGWIVGLGLTQDLTQHLNIFVEYNRYDYGRYELDTYNNVLTRSDHFTQNIYAAAYSIHLGLNLKFAF